MLQLLARFDVCQGFLLGVKCSLVSLVCVTEVLMATDLNHMANISADGWLRVEGLHS